MTKKPTSEHSNESENSGQAGDAFLPFIRRFNKLSEGVYRRGDTMELKAKRARERSKTHLRMALAVVRLINDFAIFDVPERPETLHKVDRQLRADVEAVRRKVAQSDRKLKDYDLAVMMDFDSWRHRIVLIEERNAATVETLLFALGALEREFDPHARTIRAWLKEHVGFEPAHDLCEWSENILRVRRVARKAVRREDVMPSWLRNGQPAPKLQQDMTYGGSR